MLPQSKGSDSKTLKTLPHTVSQADTTFQPISNMPIVLGSLPIAQIPIQTMAQLVPVMPWRQGTPINVPSTQHTMPKNASHNITKFKVDGMRTAKEHIK